MKDNQTKYPQLRFKGFTDPWEKRTLGQTTTKAKSYSLSRDVERDHETGYRYIHYGDIHTGVADIVTEHTKLPNIEPANYDELRVNDLVVADASEDYQGIAEPAVVVGLPTHLVAGLHTITLRPSSASSLYLYYLLHTDSFKHFGYQMGTGLKVFGISWSNLSKFTFMIPSRPEQEMIVKLIESVDNLIAVNQRKLAKLKELKQGYLQKMFPQNGSKFPQLRFAGFADAWEQRKLEDISSVITKGTTPKDKSWRGEVNYVKTESIDSNSGNISVMANTSLEEHEGYLKRSQLQDGDVLFTIVGTLGRIGVVKNKDLPANTNQQIAIIRLNNANNRFVFHALKTSRIASFIKSDATIGAQPSLSLWQINGLKIPYPSLKEQDKIGGFFEHLDHLITLHQRKLEKLQELKKGYLQKMFC